MITIDGAGGGGQLLRTALSLSAVTGRAFEMERIRVDRPEPGLKPQHLAAIDVVGDCCDAERSAVDPGSTTLAFRPGDPRGGSYDAAMGTAGSLTLLFDALLPVAVRLDEPIELRATGGTDVKWAPPIDYYRSVKLPLLARYGLDADADRERTGYYPAGGGEATLRAGPSTGRPLSLDARGELERVDVYSKASERLEAALVADRQAEQARERLEGAGIPVEVRRREHAPTDSPGSSLLLRGVYDRTLLGVDEFGERGRPAEAVGDRAVDRFLALHAGDATVDEHTADQLAVFLALWGGSVRIPRVTAHIESNLDVLRAFGSDVRLDGDDENGRYLRASPHPAVEGDG